MLFYLLDFMPQELGLSQSRICFRQNSPWWKRRKEELYLCFAYNGLKAAEGPGREPENISEPVSTKSILYTYKHHLKFP